MKRALLGVSAVLAAVGALLMAPAAVAAERVEIALTAPTEATFSDPWMLELRVTPAPGAFVPRLGESSGHVDVYIDQLPGVYLETLPVQADGRVFVSERTDTAWLPPGTYDLRAVFTPAAGSGLDAAQARFPAAITIAPATVEARSSVLLAEDGSMRIELGFVETAEDTRSVVPVGVWSIAVTEVDSGELLESYELAQGAEVEQFLVPIGADLPAGTELSVATTFTPVAEYLPGVEVDGLGEERVRTPDLSFGERLIAPIALPLWAVGAITTGAVLGVAALAVVLLRRRRGSTAAVVDDEDAAESLENVDPVAAEEALEDGPVEPSAEEAPTVDGAVVAADESQAAQPRTPRKPRAPRAPKPKPKSEAEAEAAIVPESSDE